MTGIEVTGARVENVEGLNCPIRDLKITARQCAIIDFVGQLCREYEIPHSKGLNIRYLKRSEFCIQVSVEVLSKLGSIVIEFVAQKSKASYGWEVYTPANFPCRVNIESRWREFKVYHHLNGKYSFMPLA